MKLSDRELESALGENLYMEFSVGKRRRKKIATSNDADAQAAKRKKKNGQGRVFFFRSPSRNRPILDITLHRTA